jgi:hypothetical protein
MGISKSARKGSAGFERPGCVIVRTPIGASVENQHPGKVFSLSPTATAS